LAAADSSDDRLLDIIAALCWLYLNPERAGRQRERERVQERMNATLKPRGCSL